MDEEYNSSLKNDTLTLVNWPLEGKIVGCKWLYKLKDDLENLKSKKYKTRLIAQGFTQVERVCYNEIFSPVVKYTSIRLLLSIVSHFNLHLEKIDVKITFLHGELEEKICMKQLEGYVKRGMKDHVCLLKKSLYGLNHSPHQCIRGLMGV